jgi:hypothetical protein
MVNSRNNSTTAARSTVNSSNRRQPCRLVSARALRRRTSARAGLYSTGGDMYSGGNGQQQQSEALNLENMALS